MSNEKNYDYFITSAAQTADFIAMHESDVQPKREVLLQGLYDSFGAVAHIENDKLSGGTYISALAVPEGSELVSQPHIKTLRKEVYQDQKVAVIAGKGNSRDGIALNAAMSETSKALALLPGYVDWVIQRAGAHRGCLGQASGGQKGVPLLQTYGGHVGEKGSKRFVLAIPNRELEGKRMPDVSAYGFEPITYGVFYDLTHPQG